MSDRTKIVTKLIHSLTVTRSKSLLLNAVYFFVKKKSMFKKITWAVNVNNKKNHYRQKEGGQQQQPPTVALLKQQSKVDSSFDHEHIWWHIYHSTINLLSRKIIGLIRIIAHFYCVNTTVANFKLPMWRILIVYSRRATHSQVLWAIGGIGHLKGILIPCCLKYSPWTINIHISWECLRNPWSQTLLWHKESGPIF